MKINKGDIVSHDAHPEWGNGTVVDVRPDGQINMGDNTYVYHKNAIAAILAIKFTDGRIRNLWDTDSQLKTVNISD